MTGLDAGGKPFTTRHSALGHVPTPDNVAQHKEWDLSGRSYRPGPVVEGLRQRGIRTHLISEIIPDYPTRIRDYTVPNNWHPNPLAYEKIAEYLATGVFVD